MLLAALRDSLAGRPALVLITGEPGGGKSRLMAEACARASAEARAPAHTPATKSSDHAALRGWMSTASQPAGAARSADGAAVVLARCVGGSGCHPHPPLLSRDPPRGVSGAQHSLRYTFSVHGVHELPDA